MKCFNLLWLLLDCNFELNELSAEDRLIAVRVDNNWMLLISVFGLFVPSFTALLLLAINHLWQRSKWRYLHFLLLVWFYSLLYLFYYFHKKDMDVCLGDQNNFRFNNTFKSLWNEKIHQKLISFKNRANTKKRMKSSS